jgi:hypothetical protein
MGFYRGPQIVTDGLVLYLDAANPKSYPGIGTNWSDRSGGTSSGVLVNGPSFSSTNKGSIVFDGVNDYVNISSPNFNPVGSSDFSVSCWIKLNSLPFTNPRIVCQGVDINNYYNLATYGGSSPGTYDSFWFEVKKGGVVYGTGFSANKYVTNVWYNLVGTFNNTTNTSVLYVNSILRIGSLVLGTGPSPYGPIIIANNNTSTITSLPGNIALVKIYNRVLSETEIVKNYNALKSRFNL